MADHRREFLRQEEFIIDHKYIRVLLSLIVVLGRK